MFGASSELASVMEFGFYLAKRWIFATTQTWRESNRNSAQVADSWRGMPRCVADGPLRQGLRVGVGPRRSVAICSCIRLRRQTSRGIMTSRCQYRNHQANSIIHQHRHLPAPPPAAVAAAAAGKTDAGGTGRRQTGESLFVDVLFHRFPACRRVTAVVVESALHNNRVDDDEAFCRRFLLSEPRVNHDDALSSRHSFPPTRPSVVPRRVRPRGTTTVPPPSVLGARSFSTQSTSLLWHASCRRRNRRRSNLLDGISEPSTTLKGPRSNRAVR